jgi:hypothetical protein
MINEKLLCELKEFTDIEKIKTICEEIEQTQDKQEIQKCINALQRINNKLFETHGLRDSILDFQVCINTLRSEYDVMDPDEVINKDADGMYVQ